jgi:starch synthase
MGGVARAFESFGSKSRLATMRRSAMSRSFGWQQSARRYGNVYSRMLASSGS